MQCDLSDPFNETYTLLNDFLGNLPHFPTFLSDESLLDTVVVSEGKSLLPLLAVPSQRSGDLSVTPITHRTVTLRSRPADRDSNNRSGQQISSERGIPPTTRAGSRGT